MSTIKGVIFDMDNTLIKSNIDFNLLKQQTYRYLLEESIIDEPLDLTQFTTAMLINKALSDDVMSDIQINNMWQLVTKIEVEGMVGAQLEDGVLELLTHLHGKLKLVVITNNALEAAEKALTDNHILHFFDDVIARECMPMMKPSSSSYLMVLNKWSQTEPQQWISVGDSWIDGRASMNANIPFFAYQANEDKMREQNIKPIAYIHHISELIAYLKNT